MGDLSPADQIDVPPSDHSVVNLTDRSAFRRSKGNSVAPRITAWILSFSFNRSTMDNSRSCVKRGQVYSWLLVTKKHRFLNLVATLFPAVQCANIVPLS